MYLPEQVMQVTTEWTVKAVPRPGMSLDELEEKLKALGNKVIERQDDGIIVMYDKSTQRIGVI